MQSRERDEAITVIEDYISAQGFEIYRMKLGEDRHLTLTVDLDPGPVQMDHCVKLNRGVRAALEEAGLPADEYAIDVESPGVRRELTSRRHFERFLGERVRVKVRGAVEGEPPETFIGALTRASEDGIAVAAEEGGADEPIDITWDEVLFARLDPQY